MRRDIDPNLNGLITAYTNDFVVELARRCKELPEMISTEGLREIIEASYKAGYIEGFHCGLYAGADVQEDILQINDELYEEDD